MLTKNIIIIYLFFAHVPYSWAYTVRFKPVFDPIIEPRDSV